MNSYARRAGLISSGSVPDILTRCGAIQRFRAAPGGVLAPAALLSLCDQITQAYRRSDDGKPLDPPARIELESRLLSACEAMSKRGQDRATRAHSRGLSRVATCLKPWVKICPTSAC